MPEVEAVATIWSASASSTSPARLPSETLAGASMACAGTLVPSGRVGSGRSPAEAWGALAPRRLAVHAADSRAIGTSAVALCKRLNRFAAIKLSPMVPGPPPPGGPGTQRIVSRPSYAVVRKRRPGVAAVTDLDEPSPADGPPNRAAGR